MRRRIWISGSAVAARPRAARPTNRSAAQRQRRPRASLQIHRDRPSAQLQFPRPRKTFWMVILHCWKLRPTPHTVRKAKFAEIEKFGRKKNGARAGARHVSWESCQLAAHTRLGRSVGREDRPPQWGVVHEHTPVSIPVFMNTKIANSNFH